MALVIDDADVVREVEALAAMAGVSATEVVRRALQRDADLSDGKRKKTLAEVKAAVQRAQEQFAKMPRVHDGLSDEEIIGYNANGLFD